MAPIEWFLPVQVLVTLGLWVGALWALPECARGTYKDPIAGSCRECSSLCDRAEEQKTEPLCASYCHDYNRTRCHPGSYFSVSLNACASCTVLCSQETKASECREHCGADFSASIAKAPKRLSTGMVVLIVFIVIVVFILGIFGAVHLLRPGSRLSWRSSNPYRRPQSAPDDFDDPHSIFSSNGMQYSCDSAFPSNDDLAPLEEEDHKNPMGFSDLNLTIQNNPVT
ncbi:uncharacterized protein LOC124152012 isoform X1 [Haliotis rufescens]|uniref:uncharacterized protein LOC124152012 isoform X1 n=1 Tax=Haliotis rufescens TaxID=6454 RepID=UPI001EAFFF3C|nr:uncharacterized protein LOC124152012 isoform X1 [Haliotis rufescens]